METKDYVRAGLLLLGIYVCYVLLTPAKVEPVQHDTTPPVPQNPTVQLEAVRGRAVEWANWHGNVNPLIERTKASCIDTGHRTYIPCTMSLFENASSNHLYGILCYRDIPESVPGSCLMATTVGAIQ